MALFNEIQVGRVNATLHKLLDMKEGAPAPQLAGDVMPCLVLESDRPEWQFLGGQQRAMGGAQVPAVAGQYGHLQLLNPVNSGVLAVIEQIHYSVATAGTFWMGHLDTALANNGADGFLDRRSLPGTLNAACTVYYGQDAASLITSVLYRADVAARQVHQVANPGIILSPGTGWCMESRTANLAFHAGFIWRERALEPSELR